jgi:PST family polysaccharide transporter
MLLGYGVLALAAQRLVKAIVMTATMWIASSWRPSTRFDRDRARGLAHHGARIASATFLTMAGPRTVDLLIGYFLGTTQLGYVRVAFRIFDFVSQFVVLPFSSVALSTFSRRSRDRDAALAAFLKLTQVTTGVLVPVLFGIGALAPDIVALLLGDKWAPTVPLIQILSAIAVVAPLNYLFTPLMLSVEATATVLRQSVLQLGVGLALAAVAAQVSLPAVLVAHVARSYIVFGYNVFAIRAALGLSVTRLARTLAPFVASGAAMVVAIVLLRFSIPASAHPGMLVAGVAAGASVYAGVLLLGERFAVWNGIWPLIHELVAMVTAARRQAVPATAAESASPDE